MAASGDTGRKHVEPLLSHATDVWQRLPEIAALIDQWDLVDQVRFIEEWALEEQRLRMLEEYAAHGILTAAQTTLYQSLKGLVEENTAIIGRLRQT